MFLLFQGADKTPGDVVLKGISGSRFIESSSIYTFGTQLIPKGSNVYINKQASHCNPEGIERDYR